MQCEFESVWEQVMDQQSENPGPRERNIGNEMDQPGQVP